MRKLVGLLVVAIAVAATVGCAEVPMVDTTVDVLTFKRQEGSLDRGPIAVAAEAITPDNAASRPDLHVKLSWTEPDRNAPVMAGGMPPNVTRTAMVLLVPMPVFEVKFSNHSDQPLRFASVKISVVDGHGKRFSPFSDAGAIGGRVQSDITDRYPGLSDKQDSMDYVHDAVAKLPWLTSKLVVPPGGEWQGLVAVDLGIHDVAELDHLMRNVDKLTLEIAGADDGKPVTFEVPFVRAKVGMTLSCPQGKPPSVDLCKPKS